MYTDQFHDTTETSKALKTLLSENTVCCFFKDAVLFQIMPFGNPKEKKKVIATDWSDQSIQRNGKNWDVEENCWQGAHTPIKG